MPTLILRHIPQPESTDAPPFQLIGPNDATVGPLKVKAANGYPVEGRPNDDLMSELRWYLEDFLEYPFDPETEHAERVLKALKDWAAESFESLFGAGDGQELFASMADTHADQLRLRIESDDPRILSWPWEVLGRAGDEPLGQLCRVERSLGGLKAAPLPIADLPRDRVNILLVTARPYEVDVGFRSISRPMIDLVEKEQLPVDVHVLRPPTFERLREHLKERPGHYHILHFDGHGSYRSNAAGAAPIAVPPGGMSFQSGTFDAHQLKGHEGCLVFEDAVGADHAIDAPKLSGLLSQHGVPIMVLNACQSAMHNSAAETAFASVAASLIKAGTRSVVAMAYSLYVSAAQEFLPDFYRGLFASGNVADGVRAGRRRLAEEQGRVCARGRFDLEDWLVPVLYQQDDVDLSFAVEARERNKAPQPQVFDLGGEAPLEHFVGRDGAILQLERSFRQKPAGVLIHGLGGVGKTTLARGFLDWLARTEGLGKGCFWLSFQEVRSAEYVWNRLGERLMGHQIAVLEAEQKIKLLAQIFRENRFVIVWDNFEVVAGIAGSSAMPTLSETDRAQLLAFLTELRGGETKAIITSRSDEGWLGRERQLVALSGLRGEERWSYCNEVLKELKVELDRGDPDLEKLMDQLGGHPLAMRVLLPELARRPAGELIEALRSNLAKLELAVGAGDDAAKLYATLGFAEEAIEPKHRPLLIPLAFHERFVDGDSLEAIARSVDPTLSRPEIDALLRALAGAGLLRGLGRAVFEMHPALTGFLRSAVLQRADDDAHDQWARAFVNFFGVLADALAPRETHEQRGFIHLHGANFLYALKQAERMGMVEHNAALLQALGVFAQNQRLFVEAAKQFEKFADLEQQHGHFMGQAAAYHQLGRIAEERRDFEAAEKWYRKSLAIEEEVGNEHGAAGSYGQLGNLAYARRDFEAAEKLYKRSLVISEKLGIDHDRESAYHQLGMIAQERKDFETAEELYRKSLVIAEKSSNEQGAAETYHQLGRIAEERRDFETAEKWYIKSLIIKEKFGNEHGAAIAYHQLGVIAQERQDFEVAEKWYRKSLVIAEKFGDEHGAAGTYHQLGAIAGIQLRYEESCRWLIKCVGGYIRVNDSHKLQIAVQSFMILHKQAPPMEQAKLRTMWEEAGLPWPEDAPESSDADALHPDNQP